MKTTQSSVEEKLRIWLSRARKVVVAGIGNPLRKDDFIGVEVVRNLHNRVSHNVRLIQCESTPESFIQPIIDFRPSHIMLIDAGLLDSPVGSFELIEPKDTIVASPVSTHALPLRIFCEYISTMIDAKIALLVIQPKETGFGEGLTVELRKTARYLSGLLAAVLP